MEPAWKTWLGWTAVVLTVTVVMAINFFYYRWLWFGR